MSNKDYETDTLADLYIKAPHFRNSPPYLPSLFAPVLWAAGFWFAFADNDTVVARFQCFAHHWGAGCLSIQAEACVAASLEGLSAAEKVTFELTSEWKRFAVFVQDLIYSCT